MKQKAKIETLLKKSNTVVIAGLFLFASVAALAQHLPTKAQSISDLQEKSAALQAKIDAANEQAAELADKAKSLENTIAALDIEIRQATTQIELTSVEIARLEKELEKTEAELERQKSLLEANMTALYKRGGVSTMELLVGSESFSQFIDEQEYLERLKLGIQESTEKVIQLKLKVQRQKQEQEKLLNKQKKAKRALNDSRAERARLLAVTRGEEARFRAYSQSLAERQREINRELLRLSRLVKSGGSGSYPWFGATCVSTGQVDGWCRNPDYEWYVSDRSDRQDPWGYYYRNCTSYVAWKSAQMGLEVPGLGNGGQWAANAWKYAELSVGETPKVGSFAVFESASFGHVAYVEDVSGNEILVSEYNFVADGVYSERWIPRDQPTRYVYTPWSN